MHFPICFEFWIQLNINNTSFYNDSTAFNYQRADAFISVLSYQVLAHFLKDFVEAVKIKTKIIAG